MKQEDKTHQCCREKHAYKRSDCGRGDSGAIYGMGVLGALFYFLQGASGFSAIVMGIFKAVFWPAILMFKIFTALQI